MMGWVFLGMLGALWLGASLLRAAREVDRRD